MYVGLILLGFVTGAALAFGERVFFGAVIGAVIGALAAGLITLERRARRIESALESLKRPAAGRAPERAAPAERPPAWEPGVYRAPEIETAGPPPTGPEAPEPRPAAGAEAPEPPSAPAASAPPGKAAAFLHVLIQRIAAWFTTGNVPVKVGVVLSFIGVAFLLKYAIDRELLVFPIEFRLLAVAAGGVVLMVLGWRLREKMRVYALSLQGGGSGILFLTIFAAFRVWELMPAPLAFVLLAALAAFTGALAVLQRSRWLIMLGAAGGFLAPVLASTGKGSHVALFSYYLVLNAAILGVAWFRAWREVNLVGFVFTFVIGSFWGYRYYKPELFASTEPFLVLHFLFYQAIAILYALRQPPGRIALVDGTLVFGTPVIAFTLQAGLVRGSEYGLAISAAVLAVFYALTATWLHRRQGAYLRMLSESFIALAVAFATIAIPLALDARWTAAVWALEGAALIWIGTRQPQHLANLAGVALIFFSGFSFMIYGWKDGAGWPVLNGNVLGGVLISFSALFAARRLQEFELPPLGRLYRWIAWGLFGWGVLWWLATGGAEIDDRLGRRNEAHAWLLFLALSAGGFGWLGRTRDWSMARRLTWLYLPALAWLALAYIDYHRHFLTGAGWLAWPLAFAVQALVLRKMDRRGTKLAPAWHTGSVLLLAVLLAMEAFWQVSVNIAGAWKEAAASAVPGIVALLIWRLRESPRWPVPTHPVVYRGLALLLVGLQVLYLAAASLALPGNPGPLTYVPVLNPFDLAMLFAVPTTLLSLAVVQRDADVLTDSWLPPWLPAYRVVMGMAFLMLTTAALVRGVHHYTGVPWRFDELYESVIVQTALSIYWGLLGFAGMVWGARRIRRWPWLAGAGFMGLVVVKLFLVDLGNSGTIERVISFIGVGILLLVVGYFAPAPPRQPARTGPETAEGDSA